MNNHSSEFRSGELYNYNTKSTLRWIMSHVFRYPLLPVLAVALSLGNNIGFSGMQVLIGRGYDVLARPGWLTAELLAVVFAIVGASLLQGLAGIGRNIAFELLAQRIERDAREELFESLLGKSQTFHSTQKVGDIMARATNDVYHINLMWSPAVALILDSAFTTIVPLVMVFFINPRLILVPALFVILMILTVIHYNKKLSPLTDEQRDCFGKLNSRLADSLEGIETVKANLGEEREGIAFAKNAGRLRDLYIKIAKVEGKYWPLLVYAIAWGGGFLHALLLWRGGVISAGNVVSYMMLYNAFHFTTFISIFSFNMFQMGYSSAGRVLETIKASTELDENPSGHSQPLKGRVEFRNVSFGFTRDNPVLKNVSFTVEPGQSIAIVGRTGSGKTALTRLVTRIFDTDQGQVLIDNIDVRDWNLESLRSQTASVEQDIFLFGRPIKDNIGFSKKDASPEEIITAAKEAQAHDFITSFQDGYDTSVGDRGLTLSGGQKQRIAIARAFLANPAILILDDSTSAVDSKTEDEIQKAMKRAGEGRTTFLITHRLSQIRWADKILLLEGGRLAAQGSHDELMQSSEDYRRLFARV